MAERVLIVVGAAGFSFSNKMSASAIHMVSLGHILVEQGYDVSYWPTPDSNSDEVIVTSQKGLKHTLKKVVKSALPGAADGIADTRYHNGLLQIDSITKPDWVLEYLTYGSSAGMEYCKANDLPLMLIYDSPLGEQFEDLRGRKNKYWKEYEKHEQESVKAASLVMCYSESVRTYIVDTFGIPEDRIKILPAICHSNIVSQRPQQNEAEIRIGFVGSFLKWHEVNMLANVFDQLRATHNNIRLVLIGKGEEWDAVRAQVNRSGLSEFVDMPGYLTGTELQNGIASLDIGVVPGSNWYGSPMKIYEYGALGIPVIAPTMPTIVDSFTSDEIVYFENKNEEQFKQCLQSLIVSSEERTAFGERIKNRVEKDYSKHAFTEKLTQILAQWKTRSI